MLNGYKTGDGYYPKRYYGCKLPNEDKETWGSLSSEVKIKRGDCDEQKSQKEMLFKMQEKV